jgi:hypothetical protein
LAFPISKMPLDGVVVSVAAFISASVRIREEDQPSDLVAIDGFLGKPF